MLACVCVCVRTCVRALVQFSLIKQPYPFTSCFSSVGSLDTPASPSHHHHGVLHTHTAGLIDSVVDIIIAKKPPLDAIKCLYFSFYSELLEILNTCC